MEKLLVWNVSAFEGVAEGLEVIGGARVGMEVDGECVGESVGRNVGLFDGKR